MSSSSRPLLAASPSCWAAVRTLSRGHFSVLLACQSWDTAARTLSRSLSCTLLQPTEVPANTFSQPSGVPTDWVTFLMSLQVLAPQPHGASAMDVKSL
eukprot:1824612-Amphidinium_carterae.1